MLATAVRRIARAEDRAEVVHELCAVSVEHFADAVLVYLAPGPGPAHGPDPVPGQLHLAASRFLDSSAPEKLPEVASVARSGVLAEVLLAGETLGRTSPATEPALRELLGPTPRLPKGNRVLLAPVSDARGVIGAAVFLRRRARETFDADDILTADQLTAQAALGLTTPEPTSPSTTAVPVTAGSPPMAAAPSTAASPLTAAA
ncbi:hypothetical protein HLK59_31545, partial [Streptomyces sp. S3(2020)]|nr:hypothetical protein [Streptomyces sp. S3(2020)]